LSEIEDADEIFVLNNGSVVEPGSHVKLVVKRGVY
jgi:ABC-type transport system involved in Fe-S cluster assembly fused permease/ATPase subunit